MNKQQIITYKYQKNYSDIFTLVKDQDWPVLLCSNNEKFKNERYDIITANPIKKIYGYANKTLIESELGKFEESDYDLYTLLHKIMSDYESDYSNLPFTGGAIGYFSYDMGNHDESINESSELNIPLSAFGIYDWAIIIDHKLEKTILIYEHDDDFINNIKQQLDRDHIQKYLPNNFSINSSCKSNMTYDEYKYRFNKIQSYIKNGDCYQINFSQRFSLNYTGDAWDIFNKVMPSYSSPYSAYINMPFVKILCFSPERFLSYDGITVETKPIKGTRPVSKNVDINKRLINELTSSAKEKAENLMIVDLLRNDLGKNCEFGSVEVKKLFDIETFSNVHHLVSTIQGKISKDSNIYELIKGCFPGGSITGAPKIRAMQIINELEPNDRSIYCGSIGYISSNGKCDLNIAIRTVLAIEDQLFFWGGGGIVYDSNVDSEYKETFDKIKPLLNLLKG